MPDDILKRRRSDQGGIPDWAKFAVAVIGGVIASLAWVEGRFVTRIEWTAHQDAQKLAIASLILAQQEYTNAEKGTAAQLAAMNVKLTVIDTRQQIVLERIGLVVPVVPVVPLPIKR